MRIRTHDVKRDSGVTLLGAGGIRYDTKDANSILCVIGAVWFVRVRVMLCNPNHNPDPDAQESRFKPKHNP